jgi:hypothetical protein
MNFFAILKLINSIFDGIKAVINFINDMRIKVVEMAMTKLGAKNDENKKIAQEIDTKSKVVGNDEELKNLHRKRNR